MYDKERREMHIGTLVLTAHIVCGYGLILFKKKQLQVVGRIFVVSWSYHKIESSSSLITRYDLKLYNKKWCAFLFGFVQSLEYVKCYIWSQESSYSIYYYTTSSFAFRFINIDKEPIDGSVSLKEKKNTEIIILMEQDQVGLWGRQAVFFSVQFALCGHWSSLIFSWQKIVVLIRSMFQRPGGVVQIKSSVSRL